MFSSSLEQFYFVFIDRLYKMIKISNHWGQKLECINDENAINCITNQNVHTYVKIIGYYFNKFYTKSF